ncbi:MAG: M1 family aminopeptidase [Thermoflexus sp.]|uniref:M1 family aminopeptidase n=1 Tax=Thermoflexus sp. TaxID=1969742 RepID=UPI0025EB5B83|nr:M1 family aminopeptidase [Thermoflexus sp.]MCS6962911.1 M1 family aminopeptidase [Thermoflexus sp.]
MNGWLRGLLIGIGILTLLIGACLGGIAIGAMLSREDGLARRIMLPSPTPTPTPTATRTPTPSPTPSPTATPLPPPAPRPTSPSPGQEGGTTATEALPDLPDPDLEVLAKGLAPQARRFLTPDDRRPRVQMALRVEPEARRLRGRLRLTYWNRERAPLTALCFRAFANARSSGGSRLEVGEARIAGQITRPIWSPDRTALTLTLPSPLPPGGQVEAELLFTTTVGTRTTGYGLMRAHPDGRMVVYYGYPEVARVEDGRCVLDPPWENGDLHQAEAAHFWIRLAVPEGMEAAVSGVESASRGEVREIAAPFARNVVMVIGPMDRQELEREGFRVNGFFVRADPGQAEAALETAADALVRFSEVFSPYPFPELDLVEVPLSGGAAGVEASGLVMIGEEMFRMGDLGALFGGDGIDILEFVIVHEVAHQWWYGIVGNDAHREPWLDEGLTNWSTMFWIERVRGKAAAEAAWDALVLLPYRIRLMEGDLPLNLPAERYSQMDYVAVVYGKGAWMFEVLRREMGEERFLVFLQRYLERHRFGWATGDSWRAALAEIWGKERAEAFYRKWVEGTGITSADLPRGGPLTEMLADPNIGELMRMLLRMLMEAQP